ncbi:MAG TPA: hypothetical protein VN696_06255 [Pyrinomonadaceae bacterium]|nr:hypothetical protein [Pyrinomonadaceae bacterium]
MVRLTETLLEPLLTIVSEVGFATSEHPVGVADGLGLAPGDGLTVGVGVGYAEGVGVGVG